MQELKDSDDSVVAYSTAEYKSRIIKLWRAAKVAEKYFYLPFELPCDAANNLPEKLRKPDHYYPQPETAEFYHKHAVTMFYAEVLTIFELFVDQMRDVGAQDGREWHEVTLESLEIRRGIALRPLMKPIEELEKIKDSFKIERMSGRRGREDTHYHNRIMDKTTGLLRRTDNVRKMLEQLAKTMRSKRGQGHALSGAQLTESLAKRYGTQEVFPDGRFKIGWELLGPRRRYLEDILDDHLSFSEKREAGFLPMDMPEVLKCSDDAEIEGGGRRRRHSIGHVKTQQELIEEHVRIREYLDEDYLPDEEDDFQVENGLFGTRLWPQVRRHPWFYFALLGLYVAVMLPFLLDINTGKVGGLFGTLLPVPPSYCLDCLPGGDGVPIQRIMVPMIYAVMHGSMLSLVLLPVPMWRGTLRWLTLATPNNRGLFPVEDAVWLHKLFGVLMLVGLFLAGLFWLSAMGSTCMATATSEPVAIRRACQAFSPDVVDAKKGPIPQTNSVSEWIIMPDLLFDSFGGASFFDPRDNVLFLRMLAWPLLFFVIPLIFRRGDIRFPLWVPQWVVRNWWEIATYTHYATAYIVLALAIYARFEAFFFTLITWGILILDKAWEWTVHNYAVDIEFGTPGSASYVRLHRSNKGNQPTAVELAISMPSRFAYSAGQHIYLKVPEIDALGNLGGVWHAFSLASTPPRDDTQPNVIKLLIGVMRGGRTDYRSKYHQQKHKEELNNWKKLKDGEWDQIDRTWTFRLFKAIRDKYNDESAPNTIGVKIRGPYGSPFQSAFNRKHKACVLVGTGTGLTSALSVLKEVIERRRNKQVTCESVWLVFSGRNLRDLRWLWHELQNVLVQAVLDKTIELPHGWSAATSAALGWLGVTVFLSRANKDEFENFLTHKTDIDQDQHAIEEGRVELGERHSTDRFSAHRKATPDDLRIVKKGHTGHNLFVSSQQHSVLRAVNAAANAEHQEFDIGMWLRHQVTPHAMDGKGAHIKGLLKDLQREEDYTSKVPRDIAVCYCGGPSAARTLNKLCYDMGATFEFLAHAE